MGVLKLRPAEAEWLCRYREANGERHASWFISADPDLVREADGPARRAGYSEGMRGPQSFTQSRWLGMPG